MKKFLLSICLFVLTTSIPAQPAAETIATAAGKSFTAASLSADGQKIYAGRKTGIAEFRSQLLSRMVEGVLLDLESKARSTTPGNLLTNLAANVPDPTSAELQTIYNANKSQFGGRTLEQMRDEIVYHVKRARTEKAEEVYLKTLRDAHKVTPGKDVNIIGLKPTDVLVAVGSRQITAGEFEEKNRVSQNDYEVRIYESLKADLRSAMLSVLVAEEAKSRGVDAGTIIASEITDKLRSFTDQERYELEAALQKRLFTKFGAKILLKEPIRYVQNISVDDDPATGPPAASVTLVMFTDFQCSSCAATHPELKRIIAAYPGKIRFVVRDYPLMSIHEHAFLAAVAANAAKTQGKFFEFAERLYANKGELDATSLKRHAAAVGLNIKQFELDLNDEKMAAEVRKDMADGAVYGVSWTPSIYVNGVKVQPNSPENIKEAIDRALVK